MVFSQINLTPRKSNFAEFKNRNPLFILLHQDKQLAAKRMFLITGFFYVTPSGSVISLVLNVQSRINVYESGLNREVSFQMHREGI